MTEFFIDFEWPVHVDGYKAVRSDRVRSDKPSKLEKLARNMSPEEIELIEELPGNFITPIGEDVRIVRPLEHFPHLFSTFADLDGSVEDCINFANQFGLLGDVLVYSTNSVDIPPGKFERLDGGAFEDWHWRRCIEDMRQAISIWETDYRRLSDQTVISARGGLTARLKPDQSTARPRLSIGPNNLLAAMWLQFMSVVSSQTRLTACANCGKWFETGPGSGKRSDARFCSIKCRNDFHNQQRRETRQ